MSEELYEIDKAQMLLSKEGGNQPAEYDLDGVKLRFEDVFDMETQSPEKIIHLSARVLSSRRLDAPARAAPRTA